MSGGSRGYDVWADTRGVHVLVATACNPLAGSCGLPGIELHLNDGTGWQLVQRVEATDSRPKLSGLPGRAIITYEDECGISILEGGTTTCTPLDTFVSHVFGVDSQSAFALSTELLRDGDLIELVGTSWVSTGLRVSSPGALWADATHVHVGALNTVHVYERAGGTTVELPNVPAGQYTGMWSFGANDVWLGNLVGQVLHYDGATWDVFTASTGGHAIAQMWGSAGEVFFRTAGREFGRVTSSGPETLLTDVTVEGLWGLSPTEVFITLSDGTFSDFKCGEYFMLWFDGAAFHQF